MLPLLLYLSFGSGSFSQYAPFLAKDRYLSIISIPAILLLSLFFSEKVKMIQKNAPVVLAVLFVLSIFSIYSHQDRHLLSDLATVYPSLENIDKPIYADYRTIKALNYLSGFEPKQNLIAYSPSLDVKDSYVLVNYPMIERLKQANPDRSFPPEIGDVPDSWTMIKQSNQVVVYFAP